MDIGPPASGGDNSKASNQSSKERLQQEPQIALTQGSQGFTLFHFPRHLVPYSEFHVGSKGAPDLSQMQSYGFFSPTTQSSQNTPVSPHTHSLLLAVLHGSWERLSTFQLNSPNSILGRHQSNSSHPQHNYQISQTGL